MNRSLPAAAAPAATVEAAPLEAAREGVPGSGSGTAGATPREAAQVGLAEGGSEARQCRNWLSGFGSGLVGGRGLGPLTFQLLRGCLRYHRRSRGGLAEIAVDQGEGHPGVRGVGAVDGAPGGEGRQGLLEALAEKIGNMNFATRNSARKFGSKLLYCCNGCSVSDKPQSRHIFKHLFS